MDSHVQPNLKSIDLLLERGPARGRSPSLYPFLSRLRARSHPAPLLCFEQPSLSYLLRLEVYVEAPVGLEKVAWGLPGLRAIEVGDEDGLTVGVIEEGFEENVSVAGIDPVDSTGLAASDKAKNGL